MVSFKCNWCPRVCPTAQGLKSHITRLHKNDVEGDLRHTNEDCSQTAVKRSCMPNLPNLPKNVPSTSQVKDLDLNSQGSCCPTGSDENSEHPFSLLDMPLESLLANLRANIKVIHRIPKGARMVVADALCITVDKCTQENSVASWERLLLFCASCLQVPPNQNQRKVTLTSFVKSNVNAFLQGRIVNSITTAREVQSNLQCIEKQLAKRVEAKIAEGDVVGAVRLLSSEDTLAPYNADTLDSLRTLHPVQVSTSGPTPGPEVQDSCLKVTERDVRGAINSFLPGSAGGLDMLRPQHLKDLTGPAAGSAGLRLISSISKLVNVMLAGAVPESICPVLYGAALCALKKKNGGIRPIAIGSTWRRLVAKVGSQHIRSKLSEVFCPTQLGFGIKGGSEAAAHAARRFITYDHTEPKVFLKIDFRNAFNTVNREIMLRAAFDRSPELYPFLYQCYHHPSHLAFGEDLLSSSTGIQQGDPLGPALFCMVTLPVASSVRTEFNVWYLDDAALGGRPDVVLAEFKQLTDQAAVLGLEVNFSKCELFVVSAPEDVTINVCHTFKEVFPDILTPVSNDCTLLGAPLVPEAISKCLNAKTQALSRISSRLSHIKAHVAYFILKNSQAIPKLNYILRCAPTWRCEASLISFDQCLRSSLEAITNTRLKDDAWEQASLPIAMGGLGIRHACSLAIPAFLASVHSVANLVDAIIPTAIKVRGDPLRTEGVLEWTRELGRDPPIDGLNSMQKTWEVPRFDKLKAILYERAANPQEKARLLGVATKESGAFLNALPSTQLGTLLDNDAFRISVALRLGSSICEPHDCVCGAKVDKSGVHGLSCIKSSGRVSRHAAINDIVRRGLVSANIPAVLEPTHLTLEDNGRPDGITQIPWMNGKSLIWDSTCTDGLAPSLVASASIEPLYAATMAEKRKNRKYVQLQDSYIFSPIAVECLGSIGRDSLQLLQVIGKKIAQTTGESRASEYLIQRISVAIQRGNAASVLGTIQPTSSLDQYFTFL